jgi:hypothetical protein
LSRCRPVPSVASLVVVSPRRGLVSSCAACAVGRRSWLSSVACRRRRSRSPWCSCGGSRDGDSNPGTCSQGGRLPRLLKHPVQRRCEGHRPDSKWWQRRVQYRGRPRRAHSALTERLRRGWTRCDGVRGVNAVDLRKRDQVRRNESRHAEPRRTHNPSVGGSIPPGPTAIQPHRDFRRSGALTAPLHRGATWRSQDCLRPRRRIAASRRL